MYQEDMFTQDEILLATGRFDIVHTDTGSIMRMAPDFDIEGQALSTIDDCEQYSEKALQRGYKIYIRSTHVIPGQN